MWLRFTHVARTECRVADWKALAQTFVVALVLALLARNQQPGLASQGDLLRMGLAVLSAGVLLALEDDEGEATRALPTLLPTRLFARLATIIPAWISAVGVVLTVSRVPNEFIGVLLREGATLLSFAVLLGAVGFRVLVPHYSTGAAMVLTGGLLTLLFSPTSMNPFWNGLTPSVRPSGGGWYLAGVGALAVAIAMTRRSSLILGWQELFRRRSSD